MATKERAQYDRVYEIMDLINKMSTSFDGLSYDDIMTEYGWERRTTERMVSLISTLYPTAFIKEIENKKAFFKLEKQKILPPNYITENDLSILAKALQLSKGKEFEEKLKNLYNKILTFCIQSRKSANNLDQLNLISGIASFPRPHIKIDENILKSLHEGILSFHKVKLDYTSSQSGRKKQIVSPLGFLYGGKDYLIAKSENNIIKLFILSEINNVEMLKDTFDANNFDVNEYAKKSFGVFQNGKQYNVKLLVDKSMAQLAKKYEFHNTQKLTEQPDGSLLVEFSADGLREMVYFIMTWEGKIKILEPKELINEWNETLDKLKKI